MEFNNLNLINNKLMRDFSFEFQWASFIGFGIAWQNGRFAICIPFVMFEVSWRS